MATFTTTIKHGLRWLTGTNAILDIDAGFQALAEDVDAKLTPYDAGLLAARPTSTAGSPGITGREYRATDTGQVFKDYGTGWVELAPRPAAVTALPTTGLYDGLEVYYRTAAMAVSGDPAWHLRYNAAGGTYKWEVLSGELLSVDRDLGALDAGVFTWANLNSPASAGPVVVLPLAGEYRYELGAIVNNAGNNGTTGPTIALMGFAVGAAAPVDAGSVSMIAGLGQNQSVTYQLTAFEDSRIFAAAATLTAKYEHNNPGAQFRERMMRFIPLRVG